MVRILITGAGGAAAVSLLRHPRYRREDLFAADIDRHAAGLYLVGEHRRSIVPPAGDPSFVDDVLDLCAEHGIDVLIPTVDDELLPISLHRSRFEAVGTRVMVESPHLLRTCLDKATLLEVAAGLVPVPKSTVWGAETELPEARRPLLVKPRSGSGSRGVRRIDRIEELERLPRDGSLLVQEHLPGAEYSVDAVAGAGGRVLAAVPRERLKIDSGIAVAARSLRDDDLERHATGLTEALGLRFTANVQFKRDAAGVPKLLEINPRFPGTMPLTVRSGVDIPALCLDKVLGWPLPRRPLSFEPTVMVRHWRETWPEALVGEGAADTGPEFRPRRAAAG